MRVGHHPAIQALFAAWYNFGRKYEALGKQTPAMASNITDHGMDDQRTDRKGGGIAFVIGMVVFVLGNLMLCWCPWMFAISATVFGVAAATASKPFYRGAAVVLIFASAGYAIYHATIKERVRSRAYALQEKNDQEELKNLNLTH
jgi:hypothetical protein